MIVTKKHKLYVRDHKKVLRNLYKAAPSVYLDIVTAFITGDGNKRYAERNKEAKFREDFKPVPVSIDPLYSAEFKKLLRDVHGDDNPRTSLVVSYNGSWQPLAEVSLEKVEEIKVGVTYGYEKGSKFDRALPALKDVVSVIYVAVISKGLNSFNLWVKENGLELSTTGPFAYSADKNFKYMSVSDTEDTTGKRFDYYEVIEDWGGAAELIGIVETRLKKD